MGRNRWVRTALSLFVSAAMVSGARVAAQTGRHLYEQKCGRCHTVVEPDEYSAEEWPGVVRSMKAQAALSQQEYAGIVEYLVSSAGEEGGKSGGGRPVVGGYLYSEYFQTEERTKNFDIHYLSLYANDRIYYFGEFELEHGGTGGTNTFVEQAYLEYWVIPNVAIKIGALLTPFNRFDEFHDPLRNYTITRPQVSREIGVSAWKEVGVDLRGYLNLSPRSSIAFDLYTVNGL